MEEKKPLPVIAIAGPTAVGKTAVSIELAKRVGGEVISVDSRQVYRYLDVGADKISPSIRREVLHHMIDVVDPDQVFSAADFVLGCRDAVERIRARGRVPIFAGGTPFYYDALFGSGLSKNLPRDGDVRRELEDFARREGKEALHDLLRRDDPETAGRLHVNDVRRVVRALEIRRLTGRSASSWYALDEKILPAGLYDVLYIGLTRPRPLLYEAIERRVQEQFASGFPEEVEWLLAQGFDERFPSMQGFGYRELVQYFRGEMTLEEAAQGDIRSTKAFSRRQMTWFSKFSPILWYDTTACIIPDLAAEIEKEVRTHLEKEVCTGN